MNFSQITIGGHLTRDPEILFSKTGEQQFCRFTVAYNDSKKVAIFFNAVAFGRTAELIMEHFTKGQAILISGQIQDNSYTDKDGMERKGMQIIVQSFAFCGKKKED